MDIEAMKKASSRKCYEIVSANIEELAQFFADYLCESAEDLVGTTEWIRMAEETGNILACMEAATHTIFNEEMFDMISDHIKERSVEIYKVRRNVTEED